MTSLTDLLSSGYFWIGFFIVLFRHDIWDFIIDIINILKNK